MTRVAICGLGNIGSAHVNNLQSMRGCVIQGIFDSRLEHCRSLASNYGTKAYANMRELLDDATVDAVVIATPTSSHRELVCDTLAAGKHVFVEKPIAGTLEDAEAIAARAKTTDLVVQIGFCERFNPQYQEAKRAVNSGALGELRAIYSSRIAPYSLGDTTWELGVLDTAVHNLDLILWMMGRMPSRLQSRGVRIYNDSLIPHSMVTTLEWKDGALASDQITWLKDDKHPLHQCARSRMLLIGTQGSFEINLDARPSALLTADGFQMIDTVILGGPEYYSCLRLQFEAFLRAIENGDAVLAPVQDAIQAEILTLAAQESMKNGGPVMLV